MKCPYCNAEISDDSLFCGACGKKLPLQKECIECGKQAVAFWPVIDPDIPSHPYCRKCLDKAKMEAMLNLQKIFDKD